MYGHEPNVSYLEGVRDLRFSKRRPWSDGYKGFWHNQTGYNLLVLSRSWYHRILSVGRCVSRLDEGLEILNP